MPRGGITALCLKSVWLKFQRHPTNNENYSPGHQIDCIFSRDFDSYRGVHIDISFLFGHLTDIPSPGLPKKLGFGPNDLQFFTLFEKVSYFV